jgi:tRNA(Ile)-lysidine synthase
MKTGNYTYLLTAHQLNDRLEWMLMQLTRGAGLPEMMGIRSLDVKEDFTILRPLLQHTRDEIEAYLHEHQHKHFIDESNADERYTRNRFRKNYSTPLIREYAQGLRRSFTYLDEDCEGMIETLHFEHSKELYYAKNPKTLRSLLYGIDKMVKRLGNVMSANEKEVLKKEKWCMIGRKYIVVIEENYTFIAPTIPTVTMDKEFKEACRKLKIHPKLRGYLYSSPEAYTAIRRLKEL